LIACPAFMGVGLAFDDDRLQGEAGSSRSLHLG
jgi:hypothetical protein